MKKFYLYLIIAAVIGITGCEQTAGDEEFPYKLQLVINGVLESGKQIKNIYIGRTLPIGVKYTESFAAITNADVVLAVDSLYYPMKHTGDGYYSCNVIAVKGKKYSLLVNWEDKFANATTTVPIPGTVTGGSLVQRVESGKSVNYVEAYITPFRNETYAVTWTILGLTGNIQQEATIFNEVNNAQNSNLTGIVKVLTAEIPKGYITQDLGVRVYVYDEPYFDYYKTQNSNKVSDAVFGQAGSSVKWNVKGDGIGLFIGRTIVDKNI